MFKKNKRKTSSINKVNDGPVGILVVNGGPGKRVGQWLQLCLQRITKHTFWPDYRVYIWNNNVDDGNIPKITKKFPRTVLIQADPEEELGHIHATPLQKLYEIAREDNVKYIVTMDTDAFPIRDKWLAYLIRELDSQTVISGVWRDELKDGITPYVHPSCLCTTVAFIEKYRLRFDDVDVDVESGKRQDTLTHFSALARSKQLQLSKLFRSNKNQLHYIIGGIYGDMIYHQGAASRTGAFFWGDQRVDEVFKKNKRMKNVLTLWALESGQPYIDWLMGKNQVHRLPETTGTGKIVVTGFPGIVDDYVVEYLAKIGFDNIAKLPAGHLSDIREALPLIAIYTHPLSTLESREKNGKTDPGQQLKSWETYAANLKRLRKRFYFPLLLFDPLAPGIFLETLFQLAVELGKNPDAKYMSDFETKWPADKMDEKDITRSCRALFRYLEKHTYKIEPGSFAFQVVKHKIEMRK